MSTDAGPSTNRGDITLQPSYFTSSLYVVPLRDDINMLIRSFAEQYMHISSMLQPFALFKKVWAEQGWCWLHFKVFDARARESFINVTERLFLERMVETEPLLARVVALFALYAFYFTQPSTSSPALRSLKHIAIAVDLYEATLALPAQLADPSLLPLRPFATYVLTSLLRAQAFHILPHSSLRPYNPSLLPREVFMQDGQESAFLAALTGGSAQDNGGRPAKKKGRPTKREKVKKAKDALNALEKYLDKNTTTVLPERPNDTGLTEDGGPADPPQVTHSLIAQPPNTTRRFYRTHKAEVMDILDNCADATPSGSSAQATDGDQAAVSIGQWALRRGNEAVLARLKHIDALAAEKGLEVGSEGGEKTGLARVERAVRDMYSGNPQTPRGGILGLLDGAGLADSETESASQL
ncbi:hypothetical protein WOLCODRAFT_94076 [Wolfiporia cocos MD-104 SS10]|uniref:Uncharacterized protein n=1 Tax=Wolfiporia cocos (strain MD-104) TaxID=742152 RepID=A0A2H3IWD6_WOLCO|nr:hypothetical protein WOLCODRAFT_94076 [Wolfiporia cocos MD-104 SS10]